MIWYIGPESKVYHTRRYCPGLNNKYRYWSVDSAESVEALKEVEPYKIRRLCKICERASADR